LPSAFALVAIGIGTFLDNFIYHFGQLWFWQEAQLLAELQLLFVGDILSLFEET
jgi:hypothetical protein